MEIDYTLVLQIRTPFGSSISTALRQSGSGQSGLVARLRLIAGYATLYSGLLYSLGVSENEINQTSLTRTLLLFKTSYLQDSSMGRPKASNLS
jgi:hypothetical protein